MPVVHRWWNDPDNFGATGLEHSISFEEALAWFHARPAAEPYEEWFAICVEGVEEPVGIIVIAPGHPQENLVSIGSIIIDKKYRRRGFGRQAIQELEAWVAEHYPGMTLSLGVFEAFPEAKEFWIACGYTLTETVETGYEYQGRKQRAFKFEKILHNVTNFSLAAGP